MILAARAQTMCQQFLAMQKVETGNAAEHLNAILDQRNEEDEEGSAGAVPRRQVDRGRADQDREARGEGRIDREPALPLHAARTRGLLFVRVRVCIYCLTTVTRSSHLR